jgi:hypothetical protein
MMSPSASHSEVDTMETSSGVGSDHTHMMPLLQSLNCNQKEKELLNHDDAQKDHFDYQNVRIINETDV